MQPYSNPISFTDDGKNKCAQRDLTSTAEPDWQRGPQISPIRFNLRSFQKSVKSVQSADEMIVDPDGNHLAFAEAIDQRMARELLSKSRSTQFRRHTLALESDEE
jgi:hypothetical protein